MPTGAVSSRTAPVEHDLRADRPALARSYRPDLTTPGVFGCGFRTLIDLALKAVDGHVVVDFPDGRRLRFVPTSRGWLCTAGPRQSLTVDGRAWHLLIETRLGAATAQFDRLGRLAAWTSPAGSIGVRRDERGCAISIVDGGDRLGLGWTDGVITRATTGRGQTVSYRYDVDRAGERRLTRVHRPDGVVSYTWTGGTARRAYRAAR